jgi:hypothetical protein
MRFRQQIGAEGYRDLVLAIVISVLAIISVLIQAPALLRLVLVIPLALFLPGYVLVSALFPAISSGTLDPLPGIERLILSIGCSIALTMLLGLAVAWPPIGLSSMSWTLALAALTILGSVVAWLRRPHHAHDQGRHWKLPPTRHRDRSMLAVALVAAVGIMFVTRVVSMDQEPPAPVQLWMLPAAGGLPDARVGVRAGGEPGRYTVRLSSAGIPLQEYSVSLGANEDWQTTISLTSEDRERPIVARLYGDPTDAELRFVVLQPPLEDN